MGPDLSPRIAVAWVFLCLTPIFVAVSCFFVRRRVTNLTESVKAYMEAVREGEEERKRNSSNRTSLESAVRVNFGEGASGEGEKKQKREKQKEQKRGKKKENSLRRQNTTGSDVESIQMTTVSRAFSDPNSPPRSPPRHLSSPLSPPLASSSSSSHRLKKVVGNDQHTSTSHTPFPVNTFNATNDDGGCNDIALEEGVIWSGTSAFHKQTVMPTFNYNSPAEVELLCRLLMIDSLSHSTRERNGSIVFDKLAVLTCRLIFEDALVVFHNPSSLNLFYATFISEFCEVKIEALARVKRAQTCDGIGIVLQFMTYARSQDYEKFQRASALGKGLDSIALIELKKLQQAAAFAHINALQHITGLWKYLEKTGSPSVSAISEKVELIVLWKKRGQKAYSSLMEKDPNSVEVIQAYASFLRDVADDESGARFALSRARQLKKENGRGDESEYAGSVGMSSNSSFSSAAAASNQPTFRNEGEKKVNRMNRHVRLFLLTVAVVMAATFTYLHLSFSDMRSGIVMLNNAGIRRATTLMCGYGTRSMLIGERAGEADLIATGRSQILGASATLQEFHRDLHLHQSLPQSVMDYQNENSLSLYFPLIDPITKEVSYEVRKTNVWDFGNTFIHNSRILASSEEEWGSQSDSQSDLGLNTQYLFVTKNMKSLLGGYDYEVDLLEEDIHTIATVWTIVMLTSTGVVTSLLLCLVLFVFRPGIKYVQSSIEGVVTIATCIDKRGQ